jgi:hypothetical protein
VQKIREAMGRKKERRQYREEGEKEGTCRDG